MEQMDYLVNQELMAVQDQSGHQEREDHQVNKEWREAEVKEAELYLRYSS